MDDQKHFKYEAKEVVTPKEAQNELEIVDVSFLTPAMLKTKEGTNIQVSVDLVKRLVYRDESVDELLSKRTFSYLDAVNTLPEDFFQAGDEIHEKAEQALTDHETIKEEQVGGN